VNRFRQRPDLLLLCLAALILPIVGGRFSLDIETIEPGWGWLFELLSTPPLAGYATFAVLVLVGLAASFRLATTRVIHLPNPLLMASLGLLLLVFLVSLMVSSVRWDSLVAFLPWATAILALFTAVLASGREADRRLCLGFFVAGCSILALRAVLEYFAAGDPNWRVFGSWINPNALAGMLLLGIFATLAAASSASGRARTLFAVALLLQAFALGLTQSRGGYLAAIVGLGVCAALVFALVSPRREKYVALGISALLLVGIAGAFVLPRVTASAPAAAARIASSTSEVEQSTGFRILLYQSAIELVKENPTGTGLGSFHTYSARPGLNTPTRLAHNSYFELAVETSLLGFIVFLGVLALWLQRVWKGIRRVTVDRKLDVIFFTGALAATATQAVFESSLAHLGILVGLFLVMGWGLLASADGASTESIPRDLRLGTIGVIAVLVLLSGYVLGAEVQQARARHAIASGDMPSANRLAATATSLYPFSPSAFELLARASRTPSEALSAWSRSVQLRPQPRIYRQIARLHADQGDPERAIEALQNALKWDPNNLQTLELLYKTQEAAGQTNEALQTAQRLVQVEGTTYFTIRSIPEVIPVETYRARVLQARQEQDPAVRARLLDEAIEGYLRFARTTYPMLVQYNQIQPGFAFAGVTKADGDQILIEGMSAAAARIQLPVEAGRESAEDARRELGELLGESR
jgi:O-antigen ligase/tetratricopeptide (TPR) repeat protein